MYLQNRIISMQLLAVSSDVGAIAHKLDVECVERCVNLHHIKRSEVFEGNSGGNIIFLRLEMAKNQLKVARFG